MDIKIEKIAQSEEAEVNEFLRLHFYETEPLNYSIRQKYNAAGGPSWAHVLQENVANGLCLKAVDAEGTLVGVVINTCPLPGLKVNRKEILGQREIMDEIIKFLVFIDEQSGNEALLAKHGNSVNDIKILAVHSDHHKKGIGRRLIEATLKVAEEHNIRAISVGCSSAYTSRIVQTLSQFRRVLSYPYSEYVDASGVPVFQPPEPHREYHVYVYER